MYIDKIFFLVYTWLKKRAWSKGYNMIFLLVITKVINNKYIVRNFTKRLNIWHFVIPFIDEINKGWECFSIITYVFGYVHLHLCIPLVYNVEKVGVIFWVCGIN